MGTSSIASHNSFSQDQAVWESLKQAIAKSSGFQSWQREKANDERFLTESLDVQVRLYLRETLETLAY